MPARPRRVPALAVTLALLSSFVASAGPSSARPADETGPYAAARDTTPPTVPKNLRSVPATRGVTLTWGAATDNVKVAYYLVTVVAQTKKPKALKVWIGGLSPSTDYTATVRAVDAAGNRSKPVSVTFRTLPVSPPPPDTTAPTVPSGLTATATPDSAALTWTASTDNVGVTGYRVVMAGQELTTTSLGATVSGLAPGTTYVAKVAAFDLARNYSADAAITVTTPTLDTSRPTPSKPLTIVPGATSVDLTWTASSDDVGVTGYYLTAADKFYDIPGTSATLTDLAPVRTQTVTLTAHDAAGNRSDMTSFNVRTTTPPDVSPPTPASSFSALPGTTSVSLTVGAASDDTAVTSYSVFVASRNQPLAAPGTVVATDLTPATRYTASVTARDAAGNASDPVTVTFTTLAVSSDPDTTAPQAPTGLLVSAGSTAATVSWAPAPDDQGVVGYKVRSGEVSVTTVAPSVVLTGLTPGTSGSVEVEAVDAAGNTSTTGSAPLTTREVRPGAALTGNIAWFSGAAGQAAMDEALASPLVDGLSVFVRWSDVTTDGVTFDFTGFDRARLAAAKAGKPWKGMIIGGVVGKGMPPYAMAGLPASEVITLDGSSFPAFWSARADAAFRELNRVVAQRYADDPNLVQWRVTGLWAANGEPWFLGGPSGKSVWLATYQRAVPGASYEDLRAAYNAYERMLWTDFAAAWPARVRLAQAAGDAFGDVAPLLPHTDPAKHPQRLATWGAIRTQLGDRMIAQFNGVNAGDGEAGYGVWLPAAFGPAGRYPGRIGSQPVGGVAMDGRLTSATFEEMTRKLIDRGYSYTEFYGADVVYALRGATPEAREMATTLATYQPLWR